MVDGAAWLKQLLSHPEQMVLLPHGEAVALARSLAGAQAQVSGQGRVNAVIAGIGRPPT